MKNTYHVKKTGSDYAEGSVEAPFQSISKAAQIAEVGDTVIVHEGTYREWVKPEHSGYSPLDRITFKAAEGEHVIIKGSEVIKTWQRLEGSVWVVTLPNTFFGEYNPYAEKIAGDWLIYPEEWDVHTGEVYLNGQSFYEVASLEAVKQPKVREVGYVFPFTGRKEYLLHPEDSLYVWHAKVDDKTTTIYANFQEADPNGSCVEINVRQSCFYPSKTGIHYITVKGFEMAQAATPWAPPTANQIGLIGPHWSKGWIIEDNIIHDAKCSAISIGKEGSTGHNLCTRRQQKPGYQYQMEAVYRALQMGWSKETIGSHIIRNNTIYDCGQNGIVGHMGCIFSEIYGNHIYNIGVKHEFFGWEIAGIKLHAPIDVLIANNRIHQCTLGIWLDWQAQGTRVTKNLLYQNDRDMTIEVTHGPLIVDHNLFTSPYTMDNHAQGTAFINNLFCGATCPMKIMDRSTPYHFPHTTQIAGSAFVYGGDERVYNNIYIGTETLPAPKASCGTVHYDQSPPSYEAYLEKIIAGGRADHEKFIEVEQPVYIESNVYLKGAKPYKYEIKNYVSERFNPEVTVSDEGEVVYLELCTNKEMLEVESQIQTTETLGTVRLVDAIYEDTQGKPIRLDTDYLGNPHTTISCIGPLSGLKLGKNKVKVWDSTNK